MRCPSCKRQTRPRVRRDGRVVPPLPHEAGILKAHLSDGTCYACYAPTMGSSRDGKRQRVQQYQEPFDLERTTQSLMRYFGDRRRRGVPGEGLHESTLVRPGLFLSEVP